MDILNGKKLLLVDDDQYNIFALEAALEDYGLNILVATNGREAVNAVTANADLDIVLMDIMMPEMDGYEAMRIIRAMDDRKKLPIIALTAKAMKADIDNCFEAGATDYMSKPIDVSKLVAMMIKHMEQYLALG